MRKKRMFKNALWFIEVLAVVLVFYSCAGSVSPNNQAAPARTGLNNGAFLPCPGSPNCVSSMEVSGPAAIAPLDSGLFSRSQAVERLLALLQAD
ncbi:MAG: hypothetical protein KKI09_09815, partial [Spirochaetes bacterium]|nr:hypothetical protein [Spirochaetota bacterium]